MRAPRLASPPDQNKVPQRRHASASLRSASQQYLVLYDEDCGFCKWSLNKLLAWDRDASIRPVAIQSDEGERLLNTAGVPAAAHLDSWHVVLPDGELRSAGAAAAPLVSELPAGQPLAALFKALPRATDRTYRFVAGHRDWFARRLGIDATCQLRR